MDADDQAAHQVGPHAASGCTTTRRHLDRRLVAAAAVALVERRGLAALTMCRVAMELGVEAMSLYHHVASRDDLLDAMVEHLLDSVDDTLAAENAVTILRGDWPGRVRSLATAVRSVALVHPQTFPLVVDHGVTTDLFRAPLRRASWYEVLLDDMTHSGLESHQAVKTCHRLAGLLLGYLLLEVAQTRTRNSLGANTVLVAEAFAADAACGMTPNLVSLMSRPQTDEDFDRALDHLIETAVRPH